MHGSRDEILGNLDAIRDGIARAAEAAGRDPSDVRLVAAAKTVPIQPIRWVVAAGVSAIGENYVKELRALAGQVQGVRWHFIGTLQTNTAHHVAALADVVETVTGDRATERVARRAAASGRILDALLEVDYTGERSGVPPDEAVAVAMRLAAMDGLRLRGLMTLPPPTPTAEEARPWFRSAPSPEGPDPGTAPRGGGLEHGDVVGLPGCGGGRRYDGAHRNGVVRSHGRRESGRIGRWPACGRRP